MANESITQGCDDVGGRTGGFGCFFKFPSAPSGTTALLDIQGVSGWMRCSLQADMKIYFEHSILSWNVPNITSNVLATGTWYWISAGMFVDGNMGTYSRLYISQSGSVEEDSILSNGVYHTVTRTITGVFGVGVPISSLYDPFPNNVGAGWLWSKPRVVPLSTGNSGGAFAAPSADWTSIGTNGGAWNCRESSGHQTSLADASTNNIPLLEASQGLTVATEGPF